MKAVKTLLTVLLCMAMVALSGGILGTLLLFGSGQTGSVSTVETDLGARYGNAIHNQLADALAGIASVKKTYWIAADAPAALAAAVRAAVRRVQAEAPRMAEVQAEEDEYLDFV